MGKRGVILAALAAALLASSVVAAEESLLLRCPDIHGDKIVFSYGRDLWLVSSSGGTATRLTTHAGNEVYAKFSPDGKTIAFSALYDGNTDVFTIPAEGGVPKRLTYHPSIDMALEWHPSGEKVLYRSPKESKTNPGPRYFRLFTVPAEGGYPEALPLFEGELTSYSPDGKKIAYNRMSTEFRTWKRYRGGMVQNIWIYDLAKNEVEKIMDYDGTDAFPMWYKDSIYFISDRDHTMNIFRYDLLTKETRKITDHDEYDVKWPSIGGDAIVYENGGALYVLDLKTEKTNRIRIHCNSEENLRRPFYCDASGMIRSYDLSTAGKRAIFGARGDVFTVPAEKGEVRNLTGTPGIRERSPAFSPDGKWVAYLSDKTGEYQIYLRKPDGSGEERQLTSKLTGFPIYMRWSPDSKLIASFDQTGSFYFVDAESGKITEVDLDRYADLNDFDWSADGKWLAYAKTADNGFTSIYLYSVKEGKSRQVTSDMFNDFNPAFDPDGKYLYFLSNRLANFRFSTFEAAWDYIPSTKICVATLKADAPSPFAPESDEVEVKEEEKKEEKKKEENGKDEAGKEEKKDEEGKEAEKEDKALEIDLEGFESRVVALPLASGIYGGLAAVSGKVLFMEFSLSSGTVSFDNQPTPGGTLKYFDMGEREEKTVISDITGYALAPDGGKILYGASGLYGIIDIAPGKNVGDGKIGVNLQMKVDPLAEWRQMFYEAWRLERDFFYVENMHGVNWDKIKKRYEVFLPYLTCRDDLNYIIGEVQAELNVGHAYIGGGAPTGPAAPSVGVGLLGCDFEVDHETGRYKFAKIYTGRNWDNLFRAPLAQPGMDIKEGQYLLSINGRELVYPVNPEELLENTAGHQVVIKVGAGPKDENAKEYTVEPVESDINLRYSDWVETNRLKVLEASGGKIGYLHVPDTNVWGLMQFGKYFYAQANMDGIIIDGRYNSGGWLPSFFVDQLGTKLTNLFKRRDRMPLKVPPTAVTGHLAFLINGYAGSGGDAFPYYFRQAGLGPLIGTRTWGGLVGYDRGIPLMDGGFISMPSIGFINLDGEYDIERIGVAPDIEIDNRPDLVVEGHDPQLEKAIEYLMEKISKDPPRLPKIPKNPDKS